MDKQFKNHSNATYLDEMLESEDKSSLKVNLIDLKKRIKEEKKKEEKSNLLISAAAISAVTVFGIILTL